MLNVLTNRIYFNLNKHEMITKSISTIQILTYHTTKTNEECVFFFPKTHSVHFLAKLSLAHCTHAYSKY